MKKIIAFLIVILFISCTKKSDPKIIQENSKIIYYNDTLEFFKDSINFGQKKINKIEIYKIAKEENTIVYVYLYEKINNLWNLKDSLQKEVSRINDLECEV